MTTTLNIFYEEPDSDRWIKHDRYLRRIVRRLIRGKAKPGGVMMVALELMKGLDLLNVPYRFNDYAYAKNNEDELVCVIGKPHVIFEKRFKNPILFGAGVFSHPIECPDLFKKYPNVLRMLVPGEWMRLMCEPYYTDKVETWPVGIDTDKWSAAIKKSELNVDFLIYDKIRWEYSEHQNNLIHPIVQTLQLKGLTYDFIRYGTYNHTSLIEKLSTAKAVIFLCEHETQGIAYQQILSTNTPILAWDRGGFWQDPSFYPDLVMYGPVSSVPYWDERCGVKFKDILEFENAVNLFLKNLPTFCPRDYILNNLTLAISAKKYLDIVKAVNENITNS
ncbi:MAG: glycosyltransferase family 1 protein [Pedobacter sp.]|nr:MAG: glycosyltransferase family 1 protein [Pedobacter sp.]